MVLALGRLEPPKLNNLNEAERTPRNRSAFAQVPKSILAPHGSEWIRSRRHQMKRPMTLALITTLLSAGSAFAAGNPYADHVAREVVRNDDHGNRDRGHDRRDDHRGNDHRNDDRGRDDHRGNDRRGDDRHDYRPPPSGHNRDWDRRDWNDRRDDHRNDRRDWDRHDDRRDWNDHRNDRPGWADRNHNGRPDHWDNYRSDWDRHPNYWDNRRHDRRDFAAYRYRYGSYHRPSGYYYRQWHRGDRLPRGWYGSSYVVYDWAPYRLYAPPYGYHWVRVGDDVILTAIATGVVLDVLYNIWY
jgi:Ni/Co efflux regulator RcnB